jgi:hypothetical protein
VKKQHDLEENNFGFVDILHCRYKLHRDVEQTPVRSLNSYPSGSEVKGSNISAAGSGVKALNSYPSGSEVKGSNFCAAGSAIHLVQK